MPYKMKILRLTSLKNPIQIRKLDRVDLAQLEKVMKFTTLNPATITRTLGAAGQDLGTSGLAQGLTQQQGQSRAGPG
jgi:hypothetical protein